MKLFSNPKLYTVADLKEVLDYYNVSYTGSSAKAALIKVYTDKLMPLIGDEDALDSMHSGTSSKRSRSTSRRRGTPTRSAKPPKRTARKSTKSGGVPQFVKDMSDEELVKAYNKTGSACPPVNSSTRSLVEKKYTKLLEAEDDEEEEESESEEEEVEEPEEEESEEEEEDEEEVTFTRRKPVARTTYSVSSRSVRQRSTQRSRNDLFSDEEEEPVRRSSKRSTTRDKPKTSGGGSNPLTLLLIIMLIAALVYFFMNTEPGQECVGKLQSIFGNQAKAAITNSTAPPATPTPASSEPAAAP